MAAEELKYETVFSSDTRKAYKEEDDQNSKVEIKWQLNALFKDISVFRFHTDQSFNVIERDEKVSPEYAQKIVDVTYRHLQQSFDKARDEFPAFIAVSELSDEGYQEAVRDLQRTLDGLQEHQSQ